MRYAITIRIPAILAAMWLAAAGVDALAQDGASTSSPPLTWDVVHRSAEILRTMEHYHQMAIEGVESRVGDEECGQGVYIAIEVIEWGASDKGMRSGQETPWSDASGLPEIELTPLYKGIIRDEAARLIQDIKSRFAKRKRPCPPPTGLSAEDIARIRDLPVQPLTSGQKPAEPPIATGKATTARAIPQPLIIVVTNPDGSIYIPGTGTCFKQSARKDGAGAGEVSKTNCPAGMPTDETLRQGIFQKLGQTPLYGEPDWSDAKVTTGLLKSLQTASEPVYLQYNHVPAPETPLVIWTQEDIQRAVRQMASTPPGTQQQRTGSPAPKSAGVSGEGLRTEDIDKIRNLPLEPLQGGQKATSRTVAPGSKSATSNAAKGTQQRTIKNQAKAVPAQNNEAASQIGQQLMQGLIQGGIQYGVGRAMGGGGGSERSHSNAPAAQKGGSQMAKPQGTTAKQGTGGTSAAPSGGVMFYGVTGPSDVRLKRDVRPLARHDSGVMLYRFRYLWSDTEYVGVMAQEVALIRADAVLRGADGFLRVDYGKLGTRLMTWEEWQGPALAQFTGAVQR